MSCLIWILVAGPSNNCLQDHKHMMAADVFQQINMNHIIRTTVFNLSNSRPSVHTVLFLHPVYKQINQVRLSQVPRILFLSAGESHPCLYKPSALITAALCILGMSLAFNPFSD